MLYDYLVSINFGEFDMPSTNSFHEQSVKNYKDPGLANGLKSVSSKGRKRRMTDMGKIINETGTLGDQLSFGGKRENAKGDCTPQNKKLVTVYKEIATFPCSIFKQGSSVEVFIQNGAQHVWVTGIIEYMDGVKALVQFPETLANGKQDEWVELNPEYDKMEDSSVLNGTMAGQDNPFPKVRPTMDLGNLPEQILLAECHGLEDILQFGQVVEAWINNRWVEGVFVGFNGRNVVVKLTGDSDSVILDAQTVRLAPLWNGELKSWQVTILKFESEDLELPEIAEIKSEKLSKSNLCQTSPAPGSEGKHNNNRTQSDTVPLITAGQYASRSAMLSSLVVAWSPLLQLSSEIDPILLNSSASDFALLAVGGKSGKISFWRIHEPQCYSVEHGRFSVDVMFLGLLQAHNSWITAISWGKFGTDASNSRVLLVTGSSDGSVKIWLGDTDRFFKSSEVNDASFSLLQEVIPVDFVPVSVLSLTLPVQSIDKMLLAIGKGSGSLEVCDISSCKFQIVGSYDAHDQVVTGLAWAFDGNCLYSCSQDNSVHSWILRGSSLQEVPIPSNSLGLKSSSDLPHVFHSCFGLAMSPGNLVVAVARCFDADLLDPMYQARAQKAAVEFFWIGGQQVEVSSDQYSEFGIEASAGFSEKELTSWESNILWSLKQYNNVDKPLVLWDVIAALSAFKQSAPNYVESILIKWFSSWLVDCQVGFSTENILFHTQTYLSKIHSRQLHLINIICRCLILSELKADVLSSKQNMLEKVDDVENEQLNLWIELLVSNEKELRERLVGFSFAAVLSYASCSATNISIARYWLPVGVAQMEQWIAINHDWVQNQLKLLGSEIGELRGRLHSICDYVTEEKCSFCSASVPFESSEFALCKGVACTSGASQSHKLARCAISMQVCPTNPLWVCVCCQRWASKLAPETLFTMSDSSLDLNFFTESCTFQASLKPLCPFCGILLQRLQPEFLLSASPV